MKWRKLGHLYAPDGSKPWIRTHAANPTVEHLGGELFRVYFSGRDERNRSSIGSCDVVLDGRPRVVAEAAEPVLGPGELAMFDDCGVSIGCLLRVGHRRYLYYMGWHLTVAVPWQNALGLAISEGDGQPFRRVSRFPILPLDEIDPYTISYPWVRREGDRFRMWYGSNLQWGARKEDMRHVIKYADSTDGIRWNRTDKIVIDFENASEYAICRPCVVEGAGGLAMWFCSRGETYRIRHAASPDGLSWTRTSLADDRAAIDVSAEGWDAGMIEYPCVFDHAGARYLLYAGDGFARTGFGLAVLEEG